MNEEEENWLATSLVNPDSNSKDEGSSSRDEEAEGTADGSHLHNDVLRRVEKSTAKQPQDTVHSTDTAQ